MGSRVTEGPLPTAGPRLAVLVSTGGEHAQARPERSQQMRALLGRHHAEIPDQRHIQALRSGDTWPARMPPPTTAMNARRSIRLRSLDELVGSHQQGLRDGESERLRSFQVDHQLEFGGLLDGKV